MDNASNNNTCIETLQECLEEQNIEFVGSERYIRYLPYF
jgi:hypothetical protein